MAAISPEERDIIDENPLGDSLRPIRDVLRDAEHDAPELPKLFVRAMGQLLVTLQLSDATLVLPSRTGRDCLAADILDLLRRLRKDNVDSEYYRQLFTFALKLVLNVDIWNGLITLIRTVYHPTPRQGIQASFNDTFITHSFASQESAEQTRRLVEARVFEEIRHCTYCAVDGFHAKYFEHKSWSKKASNIWAKARALHENGRWKGLPDTTEQAMVSQWWFDLQERFLSGERGLYQQNSLADKVKGEVERQLDLFVTLRDRSAQSQDAAWDAVSVIGGLNSSDCDWTASLLHLARDVCHVFASQPTRRFVHAFTLCGTEMENWVFDRSGPYSGAKIDLHNEPEKFIQVLSGYVMMSDEELGLDTFLERSNGVHCIKIEESKSRGRKRKLELEPDPIVFQRAIVCRGTCCYRAKMSRTDDYNCVVKFSWISDKQTPESDLLNKAHERGVSGLAQLLGHHQVTTTRKLREGLVFNRRHKFKEASALSPTSSFSHVHSPLTRSLSEMLPEPSLQEGMTHKRKPTSSGWSSSKKLRSNSQLLQPEQRADAVPLTVFKTQDSSLVDHHDQGRTFFENRTLRVLRIAPAGRTISQFTSVVELIQSLRDAIKAHKSLYLKGKILHRDISENNIIITDPNVAQGFHGMLIDLDLAKEVGEGGTNGARHRTGTLKFMAIEVLQGVSHTYRHDLESFYYVLLWLCARRGWRLENANSPPRDTILTGWYTGTYRQIATYKCGSAMDVGGLEMVLAEFPPAFDCVKPLCLRMRDVLFPCTDDFFFTGTPSDPEILYTPIINAFEDTLIMLHHYGDDLYV